MDGTNGNGHADNPPKKKLIINAFVEMCSGHQSPGLWTHPDDQSSRFNDLNHWMDLAKLLEKAKFHGIFIADVLGGYDVYNGNLVAATRSGAQWPVNEPLSVISAMAAVTESLGFGVTAATTYEQPYHLARRLSTVDHFTKGRLGWNIVTGYLDSAARNLGLTQQPQHDDRYDMAEEYVQVMYKLFESSWRDDAVVLDRVRRVYTDPARIREINHKGRYYDVPGPHICQPSPQRTPLLLQAGTSTKGKEFAARNAEVIFVSTLTPIAVQENVSKIRELAKGFGRDPQSLKFLAMVCPIVAATDEEAQKKLEEFRGHGSMEGAMALIGGWTGFDLGKYEDDDVIKKGTKHTNAIQSRVEEIDKHKPGQSEWTKKFMATNATVGGFGPCFVGSPSTVADEMERWVEIGDVDGFNLSYALMPGTFEDVAELLLPELRRRGLFWDDYDVPGGTYRENFYGQPGQSGPPDHHPAATYRWKAGVPADEHEIPGSGLGKTVLGKRKAPTADEDLSSAAKEFQAKALKA